MRQRSWIIALVVAGIGLFLIVLNFNRKSSLWEAVPETSAFVLQTDFSGLDTLPDLFFIQQIRKDYQLLKMLDFPGDQELLSVLQTGTPEGFNVLFISNVPSNFQQDRFIENLQPSQLQGVEVFRNQKMAFAQHKGLLLFAPHAMQVESAIQQLNSGQVIDKQLTASTQGDLFVFPENIDYFLTSLMEAEFRSSLRFLRTTHGTLSGNWESINQGFLWNGAITTSIPQLSSMSFEASKALSVLPDHTTFCFRGKFDYKSLQNRLQEHFLDYVSATWFGREMMIGSTTHQPGDFLIIELSNAGKSALKTLEENHKMRVNQHLMFTTYTINQKSFFTYDDRYLYIFEEEKNLQNWINKYSAGKVLQNEASIQQLQAQAADFQNGFLYVNTRKLIDDIENIVTPNWRDQFLKDAEILGNNTHMLATFQSLNDSIKVKIHALKQSEQIEDRTAEVLLPIELKSTIVIPPQIINFNNQKYLFAQDEEYRLYAFDPSGNLLWEEELEDRILSKIHLLENGNLLFNTAFRVHLYNLEGQSKEGYPFELQPKAILGLQLIDFTQSGRYHYLLACENGSIYGYDLEGNSLEGWSPKDSIGTNISSIRHFQNTERDFIIVAADSTIQVYNRLGDLRFPIYTDTTLWNASVAFQANSAFPRIVATDNRNRAHILNLEGANFRLPLSKPLSSSFQFLFSDVWGDERKDYIYLNSNSLQIYAYDTDNKFKLRSEAELDHPQDTVFEVSYQEKNWIGMVSESASRISLYDGNARQHAAFPLAGDQVFSIEEEVLLTSEGDQIFLYLLN